MGGLSSLQHTDNSNATGQHYINTESSPLSTLIIFLIVTAFYLVSDVLYLYKRKKRSVSVRMISVTLVQSFASLAANLILFAKFMIPKFPCFVQCILDPSYSLLFGVI